MIKKIIISIMLLSIAVVAVGCGNNSNNNSSAEKEVKDTIVNSITAYKNKDWSKFCSLMSKDSKSKMSTMIRQYAKKNLNCEQAYAFMFKSNPESEMPEKDFKETLSKINAVEITVNPDSNKLTVNLGKGQTVFLIKEGGQWKLSDS